MVHFRLSDAVGQGVVRIGVDNPQPIAHGTQADPWERRRLTGEGGLVVQGHGVEHPVADVNEQKDSGGGTLGTGFRASRR